MKEVKHISSIAAQPTTTNSDTYDAFKGTEDEERDIYEVAMYEARKERFECFKKEQYHGKYLKFANADKEKRLVGDKVMDYRYNQFMLFCQEQHENEYPAFAMDGDTQIGKDAVMAVRQKKQQKQYEIDYWNNLKKPQSVTYKKYTTAEFKEYVTTERAAVICGLKDGKPKFVLDDQCRNIIDALSEYFTANPEFEKRYFQDPDTEVKTFYSLDKGILLFSCFGAGKTDTMRLFTSNPKQSFMVVNCISVAEDYAIDGDEDIRAKYYGMRNNHNPHLNFGQQHFGICFDDLGQEKPVNRYGNIENVMEKVLLQRYHRRHELLGKTHLTTNLSRADVIKRYGEAVYSRLHEMFNFLAFPANSKDRRMQNERNF